MRSKFAVLVLITLFVFSFISSTFAMSERERQFLLMYFDEEDLVIVSTTRSLKSIDKVAENVEVVTAADIELMNAHTVAEALYNVTGIEMVSFVGPGAQGLASIQGSDYTRVTVLLDGVPLQNASNSISLGILPVQMIEKIEIIKGPASSTWGSSFGGVINILTKSVAAGQHTGGTLYSSIGERSTSDLRAEVYGRKGKTGLYLYGGTMNSDGLINRHEFWHNNLFSKVTFDASEKTKIDLSFFYHKSDSVQWDYLFYDYDAYDAFITEYIFGNAALKTSINYNADLNLNAWMLRMNDGVYENTISTEERVWDANSHLNKYGLSGSITWKAGDHTIVAGTDLMNARFRTSSNTGDVIEQRKYAFFINDNISSGALSITPGVRYDNNKLGGDMVSPSLGITYLVSEDLLLRALVSRGFHDPRIIDFNPSPGWPVNPDLKTEKIWSYQVGAETNVRDLFRLKIFLFRHDIEDLITYEDRDGDGWQDFTVNADKQRIHGGEIDISTKTYSGFKFDCGFAYRETRSLNFSNDISFDVSKSYNGNTSVTYDNSTGLRASLKGHYIWWNIPEFWEAKYNGFIVDLNIIKDLLKNKDTALEVFFTGRNLLNSSSYDNNMTKNPRRWVEAGLRYKF